METRNYQGNFTMFWFHFQSVAVSIAYDRSEIPQEDYIWSGKCQIDLISKARLESLLWRKKQLTNFQAAL